MVKTKAIIIILIGGVLVSFLFYGVKASAGTLSCIVRASACSGGETAIWRMSGTSNAHAELPTQTNYSQLVCCSGVTGLGTSCTGTFAIALKLSGTTNAHVEQNSQTNYANNDCISVPTGGSASIDYQATNCTGFDTTLGSMSGVTNAHVGDGTAYTTKICGTAAGGVAASVTVSDGTVNYGSLAANATRSTLLSDLNDIQIATNNGSSTEDINIRGFNTACPWTLVQTDPPGADQYWHQFSTNDGTSWNFATTTYLLFEPSVPASATRDLNLMIRMPTSESCGGATQDASLLLQAVAI